MQIFAGKWWCVWVEGMGETPCRITRIFINFILPVPCLPLSAGCRLMTGVLHEHRCWSALRDEVEAEAGDSRRIKTAQVAAVTLYFNNFLCLGVPLSFEVQSLEVRGSRSRQALTHFPSLNRSTLQNARRFLTKYMLYSPEWLTYSLRLPKITHLSKSVKITVFCRADEVSFYLTWIYSVMGTFYVSIRRFRMF